MAKVISTSRSLKEEESFQFTILIMVLTLFYDPYIKRASAIW